ncbi:hypothetical protein J6590_026244 [Homalodisca vitripennis]|nr:hypothetical protein J6590_026244 [Homalodisca vitripennis]
MKLFPPRIELGTFCVLGRRDNRYTTETPYLRKQPITSGNPISYDAGNSPPVPIGVQERGGQLEFTWTINDLRQSMLKGPQINEARQLAADRPHLLVVGTTLPFLALVHWEYQSSMVP